jgi:predicted DNA-binding transcriptional regulator AlpA
MTSQKLAAGVTSACHGPDPQPRAVAWTSASVTGWMRDQIISGGGDPTDVPDIAPARFMRAPEVKQLTGLSTSTLYRMVASGTFPRPIRIDRAAARRVA